MRGIVVISIILWCVLHGGLLIVCHKSDRF